MNVVGKTTVTRRLFVTTKMAGFVWPHLQTVVRVQSETRSIDTDAVSQQHDRYFVSSLPREALTDDQWLLLVRNHWGVENDCHQIWDKILSRG